MLKFERAHHSSKNGKSRGQGGNPGLDTCAYHTRAALAEHKTSLGLIHQGFPDAPLRAKQAEACQKSATTDNKTLSSGMSLDVCIGCMYWMYPLDVCIGCMHCSATTDDEMLSPGMSLDVCIYS